MRLVSCPSSGQHLAQRLDEEGEDVLGHVPAAEKGDDEPDGRKGETAPELDQVVDQRRARLFDLVDHGLGTRLDCVWNDGSAGGRRSRRRVDLKGH